MRIDPACALDQLLARIDPIDTQRMDRAEGIDGRVLAEPVALDRDSPACDISAMDGFAVRRGELLEAALPLAGECRIGESPAELPPARAMRIYTGCPLPVGADTVLRLERGRVDDHQLRLAPDIDPPPLGADIRRRGENALAGARLLTAGAELNAAAMTALATVGVAQVALYRRLTITVVTTGNELDRGLSESPPPWRVRDSNGPALAAMLRPARWVQHVQLLHSEDTLDALAAVLERARKSSDAVVLTGGVSKGAYDYVPEAVARIGGEIIFHRIGARPGQPTLAAVADSVPVIGLPGNPLAVLCAGRRLLVPALRKRAGFARPDLPPPLVTIATWGEKSLPLTWWRPVRLGQPGVARLVALRGSGDVCGPAVSDGFIEAAPHAVGPGPYAFYSWTL